MGSTYSAINIHVVFSTKNRDSSIPDHLSSRVHEYLGGTLHGMGARSLGVGGVSDHVHLLIGLSTAQSIADVVRELKKSSTKWIREELGLAGFAWQEGYAAISVSPADLPMVQRYIAKQEEHHRKWSFRDELIELLDSSGIEFERRFVY